MRSKVLDLSQYDLPTMNAGCMKSAGVEGAILGVFSRGNPPLDMQRAAQQLMAAGIPILGFYGLIYFGSKYGAYRDTRWAIELAKRFGAPRVWLDCEIDAKAVGFTDLTQCTPQTRVAEIRECVRMVKEAGLEAGIYTAAWWWNPNTGNNHEFKNLPLWFANYGTNNPASPQRPIAKVAFGGWTDVAIHQYSSTIPVCGRERDHNYYFLEEDDLAQEHIDRLERVERLLAGRGKLVIPVTEDNVIAVKMVRETAKVGDTVEFTGLDSLSYLDYQQNNFWLGLAATQNRVAQLEAAKPEPRVLTIGTKFKAEVTE